MTEIAKELLEGLTVGDLIRVRWGTGNSQRESTGTIVKISEQILTLEKEDRNLSRIVLDDLRGIEKIQRDQVVDSRSGTNTAIENIRPQEEDPPEKANARRSSFDRSVLTDLPAPQPYSFEIREWLDELRNRAKAVKSKAFKGAINGVLDSFGDALKSNTLEYKYNVLRKKLLESWPSCETEEDFLLLYLSLGILSVSAKDHHRAMEPLVRAKQYGLAAYAAARANEEDASETFFLCALLANEKNACITKAVSDICVKRRDADILARLLDDRRQSKDDSRLLVSCIYDLYTFSKSSVPISCSSTDSEYEIGKAILAALSKEWKRHSEALERWQEYSNYTYPTKEAAAESGGANEIVGKIKRFDADEKYGFITTSSKATYFFYLAQVCDDPENGILLRKALAANFSDQLDVSFKVGMRPGASRPAATHIRLTESGRREVLDRIRAQRPLQGTIDRYYSKTGSGKVRVGKKGYSFRLCDIRDPYLKAYFQFSFDPNIYQDVTLQLDPKKNVHNICWRDPSDYDCMLCADLVTEQQKALWTAFRRSAQDAIESLEDSSFDPYRNFPFTPLPEGAADQRKNVSGPLTWVQSKETAVSSPASPPPVQTSALSKPSPIRRQTVRPQPLVPKAVISQYEKELASGDITLNSANNLITHYLQQDEVDNALHVLEKCRERFPKEQMVNLEIRVFEKVRDYERLTELYEESIQLPGTVSRKSHALVQLVIVLVNRGKYQEALDACRRWETLYQQNRFSPDGVKLKNMSPLVERQKAICLYHSGELDEAKTIAINILRSNPTDLVATNIVNGTLHADTNLDEPKLETYIDDLELLVDDDSDGCGSQISSFVSSMIQQVDIASNLKSSNLVSGVFTGSDKEATKSVEQLINKSRNVSLHARSECLFSACKLLEQIEQKSKSASSHKRYSKLRLAGPGEIIWSTRRRSFRWIPHEWPICFPCRPFRPEKGSSRIGSIHTIGI